MEGSDISRIASLREPLNKAVYSGYKSFFDATMEILDFSETIISELNNKAMNRDSISQFEKVLLAWFFRQTVLGQQAWLLASGGHEVGSAIMVRSISEIRIKLAYVLHKGPRQFEALAEEFFNHGHTWTLKDAKIALEIHLRVGDSEEARATQQTIAELEDLLGDKQRPRDWWPGRQLRQLASEAGLLPFYKTVFGQYSRVVHSLPAEMLSDHTDAHGTRWTLYAPPKNIPGLLYAIYECYQMMLEVVACQFWRHPFKRFERFSATRSELERELDQIYS